MTIEAALERLQSGDPAGALTLLDAVAPPEADWAQHYATRGIVLLANDQPSAALTTLRMAIALGDVSPTTLLNVAIAEDRAGDRAGARDLMRQLAQHLPEWDEPLLRLAESLRACGDHAAAEMAYDDVLERNPNREEALIALAGLLILRGEPAAAQPLLLRCCGIAPSRADAWDALGVALLRTGDAELAHTAFLEAQHRAPQRLDYALHRADAAIKSKNAEADLARLKLEADTDPLCPPLHIAAGVLLEHLGQRTAAMDEFEIAVALAPDDPQPVAFLGDILVRTTRLREAEAALRRATELDPHNLRLRNDHAATLMRMHRHGEARARLLTVLEEYGDDAQVLCNLANTTCCLGLQAEAVELARRAVTLAPTALTPRRSLVSALAYSDGVPGTQIRAAAVACSDCLVRPATPEFSNEANPDRRLTIGMLSGTLKTHPVGWLTIAGFEALDRSEFALVALAQHSWSDTIARRFRAVASGWHEIDTLADAALAQRTRELGIDILIDLGGYGEGSRMPACAHRLAPVQIKWVGMQSHTTGMPEMDWMLTDRWETPPELAHLYSERLLHLRDGYICYSPPPYAPDIAPLPALANGFVTFGCFNNLAKITPRVIATWSQVLRRVARSRMVLKTHQFTDPETVERVRQAFATHGVSADRLELRGPSDHRQFVGEYNSIDIVLDPFPYSGGLTTCEALWMGVPTVTVPGEIFASRHSVSHLSNAGLSDWVAPDIAGYIELAVTKAADIAALAELRAGLRARVKVSPLCDAPGFGRSLGTALRSAWRDWCAHATNC